MREPGRLLLLGFLAARRLGPLLRQGLGWIGSSAGQQLNGCCWCSPSKLTRGA